MGMESQIETIQEDQEQQLGPSTSGHSDGERAAHSGVSTSLASTPAAAVVIDKLATLDVARKAERDRRREESRAAADPRESIAAFLRSFSSRQRLIEEALQRMLLSQAQGAQHQSQPAQLVAQSAMTVQAAAPQASAAAPQDAEPALPASLEVSTVTPEQTQASLDLLSSEVASLERSAAAASYYLPPYDQKQCAASVAALRASIEGARSALAPRRRFAFGSKKVSKVRGEDISTAAAAAGSAAAPSGPTTAMSHSASAGSLGIASSCPAGGPSAPPSLAQQRPAPSGANASEASRPTSGSADHSIAGAAPAGPSPPSPQPGTAAPTASGSVFFLPSSTDRPAVVSDAARDSSSSSLAWVSEQDRALVARGRGLMGLTDATVVLPADRVSDRGAGGDFVLLGLTACTVVLVGRLRALRIAGLRGCTVIAGPVTGACFVDDVQESSLSLATYQVRVHRTHRTTLFLRVRSKPIIEHSAAIRVAPWAASVAAEPRLDQLLQDHMLGEETGCWQQVDDFGWIKAVQSPNWSVLPQDSYPAEPQQVPEAVWEREPEPDTRTGDGPRAEEEAAKEAEAEAGQLTADDEI